MGRDKEIHDANELQKLAPEQEREKALEELDRQSILRELQGVREEAFEDKAYVNMPKDDALGTK